MIFPVLMRVSSYFTPRSRNSKLCLFAVLSLLIAGVVSFKSGFLHYVLESQLLNRRHYSLQELKEIIPFETDVQDLLPKKPPAQGREKRKPPDPIAISEGCKAIDPKVVFVIRIAKCASTSFVDLLKTLSKQSVFELFFHPSGAYDWDVRTMRQVATMTNTKKNRFVYARHFYYVDFHRHSVQDYTYITFVRDPVSRFVSSYLYYHFSSKAHIQMILNPAHKDESLLNCLQHQHEGCAHNLMTKYFCGHHRFCKLGNEEALATAMENLNDFAVVGLVEEMDLSLKVLSSVIPGYFAGLGQVGNSNKNEHQMELTENEIEGIRKANSADVKLYEHAQSLLHSHASACGLY